MPALAKAKSRRPWSAAIRAGKPGTVAVTPISAGFAALMLALGFASVPLYRMFCQVTGFGGTTQRASESDAEVAARLAELAHAARAEGGTSRAADLIEAELR